ncbi:MAG: hypothetical protein ACHP6I_01650 [Rickettsiales bacterium]
MPQLNPEFYVSQLFWLFIIFAMMYTFMKVVFVPKISSVVESRVETIKRNLLLSEGVLEKNQAIKSEIHSILDQARTEASTLKLSTLREVELSVNKSIYDAERELQKKLAKNDEKLARYKTQLQGEVEEISHTLSKEIFLQIFKDVEAKSKRVAN